MPVQVYYNNNLIGEPFISKSYAPMDFGNRWGMTETVTLNGFVDPINGVQTQIKQDQFGNSFTEMTTGEVHSVTDIFKENFKSFQVKDNGVVLPEYNISSCLVDEISFDKGKWQVGTPVKYTVKLKAYDVFDVDAVLEPTDSWSWTENEDGSVNGTHKISAKGIKTGTLSAFDRARSFVDKRVNHTYTKSNPTYGKAVFHSAPSFIGGGAGGAHPTLVSVSENMNRLEGSYSVTENWKYYDASLDRCPDCAHDAWQGHGGIYANEDECRTAKGCSPEALAQIMSHDKITQSLSIVEDFHTIDYEIEYQDNNLAGLSALRNKVNTDIANLTYEKTIAKELLGTENNHTKVYQASISVNEDLGGSKVSVKGSYLTGDSNLLVGYFDYKVDLARDEIKQLTSYSIGGEYVTYGNLETKQKYIKTFKDTVYDNSTQNVQNYLWGLVTTSPVYKAWVNAPCAQCDNDDWNDDPKGPAGDNTFTTEVGCRKFYECEQRELNPYPKSLKWNENINKGTLNLSAEFSDEDYIKEVANPKWSVQVNNAKPVYKEMGAANIDGVYVVQDLNCFTNSNTKISVNGEVRQGIPGSKTIFDNAEAFKATPDRDAHVVLTNLVSTVAAAAVPDTPASYGVNNVADFNKALIDDNTDHSYPYTFSMSQAYLHSPTTQNKDLIKKSAIVNGIGIPPGPLHIIGYSHWQPRWGAGDQRDPGYKFGY